MKRAFILAAIIASALTAFAENSSTKPQLPGKVGIAQHLNAQLPLDLMLRDETGNIHRLREYFQSGRPVLLNFVYYRCPMLCSVVLDDLTNALTELKFDAGKEFEVITVSIDPRDKPETAEAKKEKIVKRYGRPSAWEGWHFLTAHETAIKQQVGGSNHHGA